MTTLRLNSTAAIDSDASVRRVTEDGAEFLVAPTVAVREGVYRYPDPQGGISRELLPGEEIERTEAEWDGVPVVLDHPMTASGQPTTLSRGDALDVQIVGEVREPRANEDGDGVKLQNETWFDTSKRGAFGGVYSRLLDRVEAGETIETSTGYTSIPRSNSGQYDGESYDATQKAVTPDHLAILTGNKTGNCSVAGGCGVGRANQAFNYAMTVDDSQAHASSFSDDEAESIGRRFLNLFLGTGESSDDSPMPTTNEDADAADEECSCGGDPTQARANDSEETDPPSETETETETETESESESETADSDADSADGSTDNSTSETDTETSSQDMTDDNSRINDLAENDEVPFGEDVLGTMTDDELSRVESDYASIESTDAETADSAGTDTSTDTETATDSEAETDSETASESETVEQLQKEVEELKELKQKFEQPEQEAQQEAAEQVVANFDGIDADDVDLSPEAAQQILAQNQSQGQYGSPVDQQVRPNMAGVPQQVTRANSGESSAPASGYDSYKQRQEGDD